MARRARAALGVATLWCALAFPGAAEEAGAGAIQVLFHGCDNDEGVLVVQLAGSPEMFEAGGEGSRIARVGIRDGEARWEFADVPPGRYAIRVFHDENSNGKLDQRFGFGPPKEAVGFSNDAMGTFGPPSFEDGAFEHASGETKLRIALKRF
jgi:uncharacterized protein (DUF2141 family)